MNYTAHKIFESLIVITVQSITRYTPWLGFMINSILPENHALAVWKSDFLYWMEWIIIHYVTRVTIKPYAYYYQNVEEQHKRIYARQVN